jgi:hypothetical protein
VFLLNECLFLYISLSTQSGNFGYTFAVKHMVHLNTMVPGYFIKINREDQQKKSICSLCVLFITEGNLSPSTAVTLLN